MSYRPYVQYAHARCRSLLRKAEANPSSAIAHPVLSGELEWALLSVIADFPHAVREAAYRCEPHLLARSVLDLAKAFNRFYHDSPVLRAEPGARAARLALVAAAATALRQGLRLLGLEAPPMRAE